MPSFQKGHLSISKRGHFYFGQIGHYHVGGTQIEWLSIQHLCLIVVPEVLRPGAVMTRVNNSNPKYCSPAIKIHGSPYLQRNSVQIDWVEKRIQEVKS
jgi:hypothetical protein